MCVCWVHKHTQHCAWCQSQLVNFMNKTTDVYSRHKPPSVSHIDMYTPPTTRGFLYVRMYMHSTICYITPTMWWTCLLMTHFHTGIKTMLAQFDSDWFQLARLPGNSKMTCAMPACMLHVPEERRRSRSSLTLCETAVSLARYRTGSAWLLFVRANDGVDGSQRGTI